MSSTRDARRVRRFFAEHIAPAAERLRARGVSFFSLGATPEESWYTPPSGEPDFKPLDSAGLEAALANQWRDVPELAALAPGLCALARSLEVHEEDDGDVSPFVYVMY